MGQNDPKSKLTVGDMSFYFDGQEKNSLDYGRLAARMGQVIGIRDKLLAMPERDFDSVVDAIGKIIGNTSGSHERPRHQEEMRESADKQLETSNLIEARAGNTGAASVSDVDKI